MTTHITADATEARLIRKLVESGGYTPDDAAREVRRARQESQAFRDATEGTSANAATRRSTVPPARRASENGESPVSAYSNRPEANTDAASLDPHLLASPVARTACVTVPMPPPAELFPNKRHRRGGLHAGITAAKSYRETAKYAVMEYVKGKPIAGPVHLIIHAAYGHGRRVPDLDATISAAKPAVDALADAGLIYDDDQVAKITATQEKLKGKRGHKPTGYTILTIQELQQ